MNAGNRLRAAAIAAVGIVLTHTAAQAQVPLNKLDACDDMARLFTNLDRRPALSDCRSPSTELDRAFAERVLAGANACLMNRAPAAALNAMSCWAFASSSSASADAYLCYREADYDSVTSQRKVHDSEDGAAGNAYLARIGACPVFARDASRISDVTFPAGVRAIARPDFGFASTRAGQSSSAMATHGFATLEPNIFGARRAIEVVEIFVRGIMAPPPDDNSLRWGKWRVEVDEAASVDQQINAQFRRNRAPMSVDTVMVNVRSDKPTQETRNERANRVSRWAAEVGDVLELEGFDYLDEDDLENWLHVSYDDIRNMMMGSQSGANRDALERSSGDMRIYRDDLMADCTDDNGTLLAILMDFRDEPAAGRAYGTIQLSLMGIEACSMSSANSDIKSIKTSALESLRVYLEDN